MSENNQSNKIERNLADPLASGEQGCAVGQETSIICDSCGVREESTSCGGQFVQRRKQSSQGRRQREMKQGENDLKHFTQGWK